MRLTIAARQSHLARHQALEVAEALQKNHPSLEIQFHFRESLGDKHLQDPLWKMPERGVFTEDFVDGLLKGEFDMVVHSWKDLPVETRSGLELIAALPRADQRDLLLVKKTSLEKDFRKSDLVIYSSSPRRIYNLGILIPQLWPKPLNKINFQSVRGNIPTRIRKMLEAPDVDGLILAKAALDRLMSPRQGQEWEELRQQLRGYLNLCEWMVLPLIENPTAAAQGAIVVEAKEDRADLKKLFAGVHCQETFQAVQEERQTLKGFGGGCHLALGISMIQKREHLLLCIKGQTPEGQSLQELRGNYKGPQYSADQILIVDDGGAERTDIAIDGEKLRTADGLFISRQEALPGNYQPRSGQILWTAGLQTWKKLASRGYWVHGSAESFGYQVPALDFLEMSLQKFSFLRLTHVEAIRQPTDIATYRINYRPLMSLDNRYECYYWKSGKVAEKYFAAYPWLKSKHHCAGFGETADTLRQLLGGTLDKLSLFISVDEFKKNVVRDSSALSL